MKQPKIHIMGGTGKMGQWLKHFLEGFDIPVSVSNKEYKKDSKIISQSDIIVVSVPISATEEVLKYITPYVKKSALVTDFTSVKVMPLSVMEHIKAATLGMHPLFGPTIQSPVGQKIVFCRQKNNRSVDYLKKMFEKAGFEIVEMTAEEHDYQLAYIQALTHATHLLYAKTILGQEKTILTKLQTPTFLIHVLAMGRILSQDIELMADIQLYNPYFPSVFDSLVENSSTLLHILEKGDKKAFIDLFSSEVNSAKDFSGLSLFQTNKIMRLIAEVPPALPEKMTVQNIKKNVKVAYLGPQGTYSDEAANTVFAQENPHMVVCNTIFDVFQKVHNKEADFGIVPAENSIEGTVRTTMDYLIDFSMYIAGSFEIPIHHQLLSLEKKLSDVTVVFSHPQALSQCKSWLREHIPHAKVEAGESTTEKLLKPQKGYGYIASKKAAEVHNIQILARDIQDDSSNATRFYIITKKPVILKGISNSKTLLFVTIYNRVGILRDILTVFVNHTIDLTKLESRPSKERLWDYCFFIEIKRNKKDAEFSHVLKELEVYCPVVRVLGQT